MSSVIVRGMEMPKRCLDCKFMVSRDNDDCILQSDEQNKRALSWDDLKADCPLLSLPDEHGRLIDADTFKDYIRQGIVDAMPYLTSDKYKHLAVESTKGFLKDVDEQPTIVPAESEGD